MQPAYAATPPTNPYQAIIERNLFGLKAFPPPSPAETNRALPAKITLTGITTILGDKRVLLKITRAPKPGQFRQHEQSLILTLGQREADLQILDVDEKTGNVTINNAGVIMTLNIDSDSARLNANLTLSPRDLPFPPAVFPHPLGALPPAPLPGRTSI